jgi:hypothetical protein
LLWDLAVERRMIKLLDAASGEEVLILRGGANLHPDGNGFNPRVCFNPGGRRIAAVCRDSANPVSIWSLEEADADPAGGAFVVHLEEANRSLMWRLRPRRCGTGMTNNPGRGTRG